MDVASRSNSLASHWMPDIFRMGSTMATHPTNHPGRSSPRGQRITQRDLTILRDNGPTDERYGQVIFQLADIARLEGNSKQAESYYWKALPLIAQSLGPEHVRMAAPLTELATLYEHKDQPTIAIPLLKRALALREKAWGTSNKQLLPTLKHYHAVLMLSDHHEEAIGILIRISHLEQTPS